MRWTCRNTVPNRFTTAVCNRLVAALHLSYDGLLSRKESYDSNTPPDLSSRKSTNGTPDRIEDPSQIPMCTLPARLLPVFDNSDKGPGGVPSISHHRKSFHFLEKPTFRFRNQSQSTVGIYGVPLSTPFDDPSTKPYDDFQPLATTEIPTADNPSPDIPLLFHPQQIAAWVPHPSHSHCSFY
jgi:hypothetical protein